MEATATPTSASATYDSSLTLSAGASCGNDQTGASVEASLKVGTVITAEAGLDGANIYAAASYSDTTEAHLVVEAHVEQDVIPGVSAGVSASADAYVKSGTEAEAHLAAGANGLQAGASASVGTAVGVDGEATVAVSGVSGTAGAGVSVGEHFEAGGSAEATFKDGKATVGLTCDIAALIGVEADVSVTVDAKKVVEDAKVVAGTAEKVAHDTEKVAEQAAPVLEKAATDAGGALQKAGKDAESGLKKTGKAIKKFLRF